MAVMAEPGVAQIKRSSLWSRAFESRNFLGAMFMVPAIAILILFLAYPLALGFWLGMTDTKIGGAGRYIGYRDCGGRDRLPRLGGSGFLCGDPHDDLAEDPEH